MTTQYEKVVDLVQQIMLAIPDIGLVHNRKRYFRDTNDFLKAMTTQVKGVNQVRAWLITSPAAPRRRGPSISFFEDIELKILGYMSARDVDATERSFTALTETVADELVRHIHAGEVGGTTPAYIASLQLPQIKVRDYAKIAGALVHYCEIECTVIVHKSVVYTD